MCRWMSTSLFMYLEVLVLNTFQGTDLLWVGLIEILRRVVVGIVEEVTLGSGGIVVIFASCGQVRGGAGGRGGGGHGRGYSSGFEALKEHDDSLN